MSGKKGMFQYSNEMREKIITEYQNGKSQNRLHKEYGISRYAIQTWLKEGSCPTKRRGRPAKKEGELPPSIQRLDKLAQMRYVLASKERYIKRLEMENELMRAFLSLTERK